MAGLLGHLRGGHRRVDNISGGGGELSAFERSPSERAADVSCRTHVAPDDVTRKLDTDSRAVELTDRSSHLIRPDRSTSLEQPFSRANNTDLPALAVELSLAELKPTRKSADDDNHDTSDHRDRRHR